MSYIIECLHETTSQQRREGGVGGISAGVTAIKWLSRSNTRMAKAAARGLADGAGYECFPYWSQCVEYLYNDVFLPELQPWAIAISG